MAPIRNFSIRRKFSGIVMRDDSELELLPLRQSPSSDGCYPVFNQQQQEGLISLLDVIQDISKEKVNHDGDTIVHLAAEGGYCNILTIVQKRVHPDLDIFKLPNKIGQTPLHKAAGKGKLDAIKHLFELGAPIDARDFFGNTALHLAAKSGCINVISFLVKKGAYFFSTNKRREWPLDLMDTPTIQTLLSDWEFYYLYLRIGNNIITKRNGNGVTILHYIAAYARDDVINDVLEYMAEEGIKDMINIKDNNGMTPVHWAAQKQNDPGVVQTLAKHKMDLQGEDNKRSTPLTLALFHQNFSFAEALLNFLGTRLTHEQWTKNWDDKVKGILMAEDHDLLSRLEEAHAQLNRLGKMPVPGKELLLDGIPVIWTALYVGEEGIAKFIQKFNKDAVNQKDEIGRTALHWATILQQRDVVLSLCRRKEFEEHMLANVADKFGKFALQYAMEMDNDEIASELMLTRGAQSWLDRIYQDRQVYVDAANAILVGAALIASVTFGGWLQPPLGNDLSESYLQHIAIRIFWAFNSLSFYFAIATVLAGAGAVIPMSGVNIGKGVEIIKLNLFFVGVLFAISIVCVLGAFAATGFAVLPSSPKYRGNMMGTTSLGVLVCFLILCWFFYRLRSFRILQKPVRIWTSKTRRYSEHFDTKRETEEMYPRDDFSDRRYSECFERETEEMYPRDDFSDYRLSLEKEDEKEYEDGPSTSERRASE